MDIKVTIETWNDVWRFEIEDKEFGERVKWGESDSFTGCAAVCLEFVAENKNAAEHSKHVDTAVQSVETTDQYWDCDCEHFYIHPASDECCEICSAVRGECPDSRVDEVRAGGYVIEVIGG